MELLSWPSETTNNSLTPDKSRYRTCPVLEPYLSGLGVNQDLRIRIGVSGALSGRMLVSEVRFG